MQTTNALPLELTAPPVAIAFRDAPPASLPHVGTMAPSGCSYWKLAGEGRAFYTNAPDHEGCPIGAYTHGVAMTPKLGAELQGMLDQLVQIGYVPAPAIPSIPKRAESMQVVCYAPLSEATFEADAILLRGTARQLMLIGEAAEAMGVAGSTMLRPTCAAIPGALQAKKIVTSLGCIGNRVYTGLADGEGYSVVPAALWGELKLKLEAVTKANEQLDAFHRARLAR